MPTVATTHIYLFPADDTTDVSPNQSCGAASLAALLCAAWAVSCSGQPWLLAGNIFSALAERNPAVSMVSCRTCTGAGLFEGRASVS